jgi:hypothetical protein
MAVKMRRNKTPKIYVGLVTYFMIGKVAPF